VDDYAAVPAVTSKVAYFNYLADAFLYGQLKLRVIPFTILDLIMFNEGYYLYWPPLPAVILMPLVAIVGVNCSAILFNIVVARLNTYFVALLLRRAATLKVISLSGGQRGWLVIFFLPLRRCRKYGNRERSRHKGG
jgi:hypothetical protein